MAVFGQDQFDRFRIDGNVIGPLKDPLHIRDGPLLKPLFLVWRVLPGNQEIAVGVEGFVGAKQRHELAAMLLAAPEVEITEEAPRLLVLTFRPGVRPRQAIDQCERRDGNEPLVGGNGLLRRCAALRMRKYARRRLRCCRWTVLHAPRPGCSRICRCHLVSPPRSARPAAPLWRRLIALSRRRRNRSPVWSRNVAAR